MYTNVKEDLKQAYNAYAHEREKRESQGWKMKTREAFFNLLRQESKLSLLEIGAGHGRDSKFFKDNNLQVTAVDLSDEMVKLCREKGIDAYEMDFYNLSSINKKFDAVWAMNCLLHVEKASLSLVLGEIERVLNPSGLFFMGLYGGEDREGIWEGDTYTPKRFFAFYTDENIKNAVGRYFDIISFKRIDTGGDYYFQSITARKRLE